MYSHFALHKLNPTTTVELNRSGGDRSGVFCRSSSADRFKVVVDFISRNPLSEPQELTTDTNVMDLKNGRPICAALLAT